MHIQSVQEREHILRASSTPLPTTTILEMR